MSNMQKHAKETVTTRDMAKGKGGKAARPIGEVEVTQGEATHDAARTVAPIVAQLEAVERREAFQEMEAALHPDAAMENAEQDEAEIEAAILTHREQQQADEAEAAQLPCNAQR